MVLRGGGPKPHLTSDRLTRLMNEGDRIEGSAIIMSRIALVALWALCLNAVVPARADSIPVLGAYSVSQYSGFGAATYIGTSTTSGTLTVTDPGGSTTLSDMLGSDPTVSLSGNESPYQSFSGGSAYSVLTYQVEYYVSTPSVATQSVLLSAKDALSANNTSMSVEANLNLGISDSPAIVNETDCVNGCYVGLGNYTSPSAFPATLALTMEVNMPYTLQIGVYDEGNGIASASIDPTLSALGGPGVFIFSPGIEPVPLPATLPLIVGGCAALGLVGWRRRGYALP
jgi:hypothetical protein